MLDGQILGWFGFLCARSLFLLFLLFGGVFWLGGGFGVVVVVTVVGRDFFYPESEEGGL